MARTLVIDTIEAGGRTFNSGEELAIGPVLKEFIVHFRRPIDYEGEYGFDWLRDEYIHPITNINETNKKLSLNINEIKKEYKTTDVIDPILPYNQDYYCSFLNLLLNQEVELNIEIQELEKLISDTSEIIFESSNSNLKVTPTKLTIAELIAETSDKRTFGGKTTKYYTPTKKIKIKCEGQPFTKTEQIKIFAQLPNDTKNRVEVGKMIVFKNSEEQKYTVNVYVIKAFISDNPLFSETVIDAEFSKIGGLSGLENYLNKKSLNQGLVQVKLIDQDLKGATLKMPLSTYSFNQANIGKNPNGSGKDDDYRSLKDIITKPSKFEVDSGKSVNFFNLQFNKLYSNISRQKSILLYLSPLNSKGAGGSSYTIPLNNKHCIIYGTNLDDLTSYAHEIAHTLGLTHTFLSKGKSCNIISSEDEKINIDKDVLSYKAQIQAAKIDIDNQWIAYRRANATFFNQSPEDVPRYKKPYDDAKADLDKRMREYETDMNDKKNLVDLNYLKFERAFTENIMDYWGDDTNCDDIIDLKGVTNKKSFNKYQWKIIQNEAKTYYH